ncbi:RluA family pseudouridine synthase [Helicobacter kayseriensis]|uniref:RluA family pseudouridine synthase n=1 Tax=Helicobacter kayseriensis TaxID=2905877 RepID=UPI001E4F74D7|nr:RluA family pseudouridine synthase [Helicobacter kayseriensis]MCE3047574.1 RluA family pseudouridine synthase [Helicobacter kayseriensis]MCE3048945.1 RluA family pseudouridine synthase [Helicobacter kayseriensis]
MKFIITASDIENSSRLDSVLAHKLGVSKNQITQAIKHGLIFCNDKICTKGGVLLKENDCISLEKLEQEKCKKTQIDFEVEVLFEDEDVLVLNKPPHLVIHDAPSVKEATLVDYLKNKGYVLSTLSGEERYGIIHRLDKPTSGAIAIAKNNQAHIALSNQLKTRQMGRYYLAITDLPLKQDIEVECYMGRNPNNRLKMAKLSDGRYSKTSFVSLLQGEMGLIAAKLHTGRTHQIRLHLETLSRHIIGDLIYGKKDSCGVRLMLHAYLLYFIHPRTQKTHCICAPLFKDMLGFLEEKFGMESVNEVVDQGHILQCFGDSF